MMRFNENYVHNKNSYDNMMFLENVLYNLILVTTSEILYLTILTIIIPKTKQKGFDNSDHILSPWEFEQIL